MRDIFKDLNEDQQQAVRATHGPVLVLAGAGSGKTRALTYRIAHLLRQKIAAPREILAVTFTNKAAGEMKDRVRHLVGGEAPPAIGTFHSIGARILREQARRIKRSAGFMICGADDGERLIRQAMEQLSISRKEFSPRQIRARISRAKNDRFGPAEVAADRTLQRAELLASVYQRYEELLERNDAYDFDDLLLVPLQLLEDYGDVRVAYQQRWRWLSVDEYQDTNMSQDQLLKLLAGREKNICAVGDDYQAIYSWRGARVDHILQFEKTFPDCKVIYLTRNYRSTPQIVEAAGAIIAANRRQKHKQLYTRNEAGAPVQLAVQPSSKHEAAWVRRFIEDHLASGGKRRDCAILYRTNAQSRQFEEEFLTYGVPYTIVGGFRFYERREVRDALAFLQFWVTGNQLALHRIADALWRGVGPKTVGRWEETAAETGEPLANILGRESEHKPVLRAVVQAYQTARAARYAVVSDLLAHLLARSGYEKWLKIQPDGTERWENVAELLNVTAGYADVTEFLEEVALLTDIDTLAEEHDRVVCMTLHAAKGLEFPRVILAGLEDGLLPHMNSLDSRAQVEEERRLLYVGMTRAKEQLILSYAHTRFHNGSYVSQLPSRFLSALPDSVEFVESEDVGTDLLPTPDIIRAELL
jgi:DNA helicase II / ATP-dependent DNA helicase PcrA